MFMFMCVCICVCACVYVLSPLSALPHPSAGQFVDFYPELHWELRVDPYVSSRLAHDFVCDFMAVGLGVL